MKVYVEFELLKNKKPNWDEFENSLAEAIDQFKCPELNKIQCTTVVKPVNIQKEKLKAGIFFAEDFKKLKKHEVMLVKGATFIRWECKK